MVFLQSSSHTQCGSSRTWYVNCFIYLFLQCNIHPSFYNRHVPWFNAQVQWAVPHEKKNTQKLKRRKNHRGTVEKSYATIWIRSNRKHQRGLTNKRIYYKITGINSNSKYTGSCSAWQAAQHGQRMSLTWYIENMYHKVVY